MAALVALSYGGLALMQGRAVAVDDGRLPETIRINLDGSYARYVGKTADGSQFLMTNAFVKDLDATKAGRRYFTTFYLFDAAGRLIRSKIDDIPEGFDKTSALNALEKVKAIRERHLRDIGPVKFGDISVRPFHVAHESVLFGLIPQEVTLNGRRRWQVTLEPGRILTFSPPWLGDYRT
jgi:hypothetical protein